VGDPRPTDEHPRRGVRGGGQLLEAALEHAKQVGRVAGNAHGASGKSAANARRRMTEREGHKKGRGEGEARGGRPDGWPREPCIRTDAAARVPTKGSSSRLVDKLQECLRRPGYVAGELIHLEAERQGKRGAGAG